MGLGEYRKKRDLKKSSEPGGGESSKNIFVVQKHDATNLHYDFRLKMGDVLKSWAIPKGPSLNPSEKRLAIETEDHPIDYAEFEGKISEGNYGAGSVLLWDKGEYENLKDSMFQSYEDGKIEIELHGKKLKGRFGLIKLKNSKKNWLLIKAKDEFSSKKNVLKNEKSVKTGKEIEEID